jgi:hypothetical protein
VCSVGPLLRYAYAWQASEHSLDCKQTQEHRSWVLLDLHAVSHPAEYLESAKASNSLVRAFMER